jgi:hypothetical protein
LRISGFRLKPPAKERKMIRNALIGAYILGYTAHFIPSVFVAYRMGLMDGWTYLGGQLFVAMFWPVAWLYIGWLWITG